MDLEKYKKSYQEIEKLQQTKNLDYYRHQRSHATHYQTLLMEPTVGNHCC